MIAITVDTRRAVVAERELLTTGSAGIPVKFTFSSDWDGLSIFAIFRNAEDMDSRVTVVVPETGAVSLPSECCATEYMGEPVYAGVYGTDGYGNTVIPTVWVSLGELREGASYEGAPGTANPTPDMWAQMEALALSTGAANVELAEAAQAAAETAQAGAEAAQTAAETAQTAAETAQGLAETAQSAAEIAQSAAEIAQAGAETAQTAAETAQGKAEDAQAGAEAAQAAAEAAQAAAEEAAASVNIDTEMSTTSEHAVQNKVITVALGGKVDKVSGKQLSTEDYTSAEKTKLAGIAAGAEVNVQADWTQTTTTADDYIKNKPANLVQDASYVHTDNNYTTADKTKLAGIPADADKTVIDDTLTQTGEAADAKATGDAIGTINSALSSLSSVTEIIDTASGAIASFSDGSGLPMRSLVAEINPIQDLHGYDAPWPAGGGKNLVPMTTLDDIKSNNTSGTWNGADYSRNGITFTVLTDNAGNVLGFKLNGTSTAGASFQVKGTDDFTLAAGTYYYTGVSETSGGYDLNLRKTGTTTDITQRGSTVTLTLEEDTSFHSMYIWVNSGNTLTNVYVYPMIRNSSVTDATYAPYSNICPISGHTGLSVEVRGKNLLPNKIYKENSYRMQLGIASVSEYVKLPAGTYKVSVGYASGVTAGSIFWRAGTDPHESDIITLDKDSDSIRIWIFKDGLQVSDVLWWQVELGSTATTYEPYTSGTTTPVSWQDEAGTVYGGTDEVIGGNGSDEWTKLKLLSSFGWQESGTAGSDRRFGFQYISNPSIVKAANQNGTFISNVLAPYNIGYNSHDFGAFYISNSWLVVHDKNSHFATLADFKAWLDSEDVYLVYKVSTPTTFTHTGQAVNTVYGQNNVFVDTGDVSVTYQASIKGYIDKVLAQ